MSLEKRSGGFDILQRGSTFAHIWWLFTGATWSEGRVRIPMIGIEHLSVISYVTSCDVSSTFWHWRCYSHEVRRPILFSCVTLAHSGVLTILFAVRYPGSGRISLSALGFTVFFYGVWPSFASPRMKLRFAFSSPSVGWVSPRILSSLFGWILVFSRYSFLSLSYPGKLIYGRAAVDSAAHHSLTNSQRTFSVWMGDTVIQQLWG